MKPVILCLVASLVSASFALHAQTASPQYPDMPSETPASVSTAQYGADYTRREVMIPMRDGVKLHTVILVPKGAHNTGIVLTRTPYNASALSTNTYSNHLGPSLYGYDNATDVIVEGGYIRVFQDVRGKYGSEGDYVMNRPFRGPLNPTPVDNSTDTYDTIDWLTKNLPESNGKVGIIGISYDGYTSLAALVNPHPALKVAVPMNPMVDGWRGDDWFHNGAFREQNEPYIYEQDGTRDNSAHWWTSNFDDYDTYMNAGSAGELAKRHGLYQMGFWRKLVAHPSYDSFWQEQAVDKILAAQYAKHPPTVPVLLVHSLWDAEDIYGATAVYKAIKPYDKDGLVHITLGPWHHGGAIEDGTNLGTNQLRFPADPSFYWRQHILAPFLARYLKDDTSAPAIATVTAYQSGSNQWQNLPAWPVVQPNTRLYLHADAMLSFTAPSATETPFTEYPSDPAHPVPYLPRPDQPVCYVAGCVWANWLASDQRSASGRPDVATFISEPLTAPITISGQPIANLIASTAGTDSDWVVKLIDLYPDEVAGEPWMGGYQLMISADIFRGRYRQSLEKPEPIPANTPEPYRFDLPNANHVFLPGHRILVQVQSSWFPLYDRNPQTFVPNIFFAQPADYQKAEQKVYHSTADASYIELPVVKP
ncbi:MAG: CocE/NonD family hydrolase [Acidobacteriaceae bacterium]